MKGGTPRALTSPSRPYSARTPTFISSAVRRKNAQNIYRAYRKCFRRDFGVHSPYVYTMKTSSITIPSGHTQFGLYIIIKKKEKNISFSGYYGYIYRLPVKPSEFRTRWTMNCRFYVHFFFGYLVKILNTCFSVVYNTALGSSP